MKSLFRCDQNQKLRSTKSKPHHWMAFAGAAVLLAGALHAADLVWVGGTGNWNLAGNWSPAQVPTSTDNAWITNNGTYTVTVPAGTTAAIGSLAIGGGNGTQTLAVDRATFTLNDASIVRSSGQLSLLVSQSVINGPGALTVDGLLDWANGTLGGTGQLTINAGGVLAIGSGGTTLGRTLNTSGAASWAGGNLTVVAGNSINNLAGGTFEINSDGRLTGTGTTPINNSGVLRLTAGTTGTTINAPLNNSGTLQVLASTLNLNQGGSHTGTFSDAPGTILNLGGGAHVLSTGSFVTGSGTLSLGGGGTLSASGGFDSGTTLSIGAGTATLNPGCNVSGSTVDLTGSGSVLLFNSGGSVASVSISGGILGGTSPVTITGPLTLGGGSITNSLIFATGGISIAGNTTLNGAKLVNPSTAVWSAGNVTGVNGAAISNLLGATFINTFDGNMTTGAGTTPVFVNAGTFQKTDGTAALGTTAIDFQFLNTGTVEVRTNTLRYAANQQSAGVTLLDGGGLAAQGQPLQFLGGTLVGTGSVTVANVQNVVNSSSVSPGLLLGELDITGNYQQTASGTLNIELGGYAPGTNFDLVTVSAGGAGGVATLGGTLSVTLTNGFSPTNGATFTFLTASSRVGTFTTFNYPSNELGMQLITDATSAMVKVTNLKPLVANPIVDPPAITYGQEFNFQFPANTFVDPDGDALSFTASGLPPGVTFAGSTRTFAGTPSQAGVFSIAVAATDNGIPNLTVTNTFTLTVNPAALAVTVQAITKAYGTADPVLTFTATGFQLSDTQASVLKGALARAPGETVAGGPYSITQGTLAANGNYAMSFVGNTLTITPAPLAIVAQARTKTYGSPEPVLTFTAGGFQFTDTQQSALTGALARSPGESVAGGPYAITQGTLAANGNYTIVFTGSTLTITPAALTVAAQTKSKTYGSSDPALTFTVSGFQLTDTQASVLTGALARAPGETIAGGPYAITQGTLVANGNYTITFTGSTLTITPAVLTVAAQAKSKTYGVADPALTFTVSGFQMTDTQASVLTGALARAPGESVAGGPYAITQGTLAANGNYTITFTGSTLTITPAALTIAAQAKSKTYGAADPALTFTASGLQFTDTQASVLTGALARASGESVAGGPYLITQGTLAANGNYTITFTGSTLTITPAALTVAAEAKSKTYGAADPALTFTSSGFQFTDTQASVLTGTLARSPGESVAGGPYAITQGTLAANGNYTMTFTGSTLTISQAALTVAAQAKSKTYGAADPSLTFTATGFQFTDTQASVLTGALVRSPGESVAGGPYAIKQGTLTANANYSISYSGATLTITPALLSITADSKTKVYGSSDPALSASYIGLVNGETPAVLTGSLLLARALGEDVGNYSITASGLTGANYIVTFNPGTLSITRAPLTVTADSKIKGVGSPDPLFTVTYSGFVRADSASVLGGVLSITRVSGEAPGTYAIMPSGLTSTNYNITFNTGSLTVIEFQSPVLSMALTGSGQLLLTWSAVSNTTYRVQYKGSLDATNWTDLAGDVLAASGTASKSDTIQSTNRFYRLHVLP